MNPAIAEIVFVANPVFAAHQQVIDRYIQIIDQPAFRLLHQVDIQRIRVAIETQTLGPEIHYEVIEMGIMPAHRKLDHPMQIGKSEIGGDQHPPPNGWFAALQQHLDLKHLPLTAGQFRLHLGPT